MSNNRTKSLKNLIYSILGQLITIAIGLLIPRLYITSYGSEINGLLNSVNQYIVYLALFEAGVGTVTLQALYKPISLSDYDSINGILSATHKYYKKTGNWYLMSLIVLSLLYPLLVDSELNYFFISAVVFLCGISNVILYYFQGKYKLLLQADGKNYVLSNLTTVVNIFVGISKVILIYLGYGVIQVLIVSFFINTIQALYIVYYIKKNYSWIDVNVLPNNSAISQKSFSFIHQIAGMIFQNTDVLILTIVCGLKIVSVYSMYKLIMTYLEQLLTLLITSFNFILGQTFQTNLKQYIERIDVFESLYSAICFSIYSVTLFLLIPFISIYTRGVTDINYVDSNLAVLFITIALLTVIRTPMLYTIQFAGHFKETLPQTIIETVINLMLSLILVLKFNVYGVLIGTVCALIYRTNDVIIYSNRKLLNRSPRKTYLIHLLNVCLLVITQILFKVIFTNPIKTYIDFICVGLISTVISVMVYGIAHFSLFKDNKKYIFEFIKRK